MRRARIVVTAAVVFVVALGTGVYLWVQAVYVLPGASCGAVDGGMSGQTRLLAGASRAPQCFLNLSGPVLIPAAVTRFPATGSAASPG